MYLNFRSRSKRIDSNSLEEKSLFQTITKSRSSSQSEVVEQKLNNLQKKIEEDAQYAQYLALKAKYEK